MPNCADAGDCNEKLEQVLGNLKAQNQSTASAQSDYSVFKEERDERVADAAQKVKAELA